MNELMEKFAEARFGKKAFLGRLFGGMDPKKKAIRDRIEDMIREEQQKRREAEESIKYGKGRIENAGKPSTLGWVSDISRSLIPGLSISADTAERMVKIAKGETPSDSKLLGRGFDLAHFGAAGAGAGLGYGVQSGAFGGLRGASKLRSAVPDVTGLSKHLKNLDLKSAIKNVGDDFPGDLALAAQGKRIPGLTGLSNLFSGSWWKRKLLGGRPTTSAAAMKKLLPKYGDNALSILKGSARTAAGAAVKKGGKGLLKKLPGKWGALIGALAVSSPFIAARLLKTRKLRASGGSAGQEAARKAEELLGGADKLRGERKELMGQLA